MQGSTVRHQSHAGTLAPEEPDAFIAHVRVCGGAGWVTTGSTRKPTAHSAGFVGYSWRFLLWAAAQRERYDSSGSSGARVPARLWCITLLPCMAH